MAWVVRRFVVFAFAVALLRLDVFAQDKRFTYGAESDVSSKYVWRGMVLDERPVTENSAWLEAFGVNLTLWANAALPYAADRSRLRVSGLTLGYERDWKKLTFEPAIQVYRWREDLGSSNTVQCSLRIEYGTGLLRLFSDHAFDVTNKGAYFGEGGVRFEKQIRKTQGSIELGSGFASTAFNDFNIGVSKAALNFLKAEISMTHNLDSHWYVRPHVVFINVADRRIRDALETRNIAKFGFALGFQF